jgi:quercetin dioxygenase-like cupin family protein
MKFANATMLDRKFGVA